MNRRAQTFLRQAVMLIDGIAIVSAFLATYFLRQKFHVFYHLDLFPQQKVLTELRAIDSYLWLLFIILPVWVGFIHMLGGYRDLRTRSFPQIVWIVFRAHLVSLFVFASFVFILKLHYVSRSFTVFFILLSFFSVSLERFLLIKGWRNVSDRSYFHKKLLIVGTGPRAKKFIRVVQANEKWGVRLMGLVDIDPKLVGTTIEGFRVIGTLDELPHLLQRKVIDEIIFVLPRSWIGRIEEAILYCERVGVRAIVAGDLFNVNLAKAQPSDFDGIPVISFEITPVDEWKLAIKRIGDVLAAVSGLIITFPLFLIVPILIKLTSPGPVFFCQTRCGLSGRRFVLYKFRSMGVDAPAKQSELKHLNELGGPVFKFANDPRLTPIGRWLRRLSIDELPQLVNVLKGEMSLVGPRPPLPEEVAQYESWQLRRLSMRPGLTGFWQVSGRNQIKDFDQWVRLDLEYIDQWSLGLDMKIILKTIPMVLFGIGAK